MKANERCFQGKTKQNKTKREFGLSRGFPGGLVVKNLPANSRAAGAPGLISESERALEGGNPLQYSSQGNPVDRGA